MRRVLSKCEKLSLRGVCLSPVSTLLVEERAVGLPFGGNRGIGSSYVVGVGDDAHDLTQNYP